MENLTFEYQLEKKFKIAGNDGEFIDADFIVITEPNQSMINDVNKMQQEFLKVSNNGENTEREIESSGGIKISDLKPKEVFLAFSLKGGNLQLCMDLLKNIMKKTAKVNDDVLVNQNILQKISIKDMNNLLGGYLQTFLLADLTE